MVTRVSSIKVECIENEKIFRLSGHSVRSWIVGPENLLLNVVIDSIFDPGRYNPIFIHGPTSVGKSHLLALLAEQYESKYPDASTLLLAGNDYCRAYQSAVKLDAIDEFRAKHRGADLLLFDDIQELIGRGSAEIELLNTIDQLMELGRQIVIVSRSAPAELRMLPGLASRLLGGLIVPIAQPSALARSVIVREMAAEMGMEIQEDIVNLLVAPTRRMRRPLESASQLKGLLSELALERQIDAETVQSLLEKPTAGLEFTPKQIANQTGRYFQIRLSDLTGPSRRQATVRARGVAIYLTRHLTGSSFETIGQHFGGRDHSTVLHAYRKTQAATQSDPVVRKSVFEIADKLGARALVHEER